MAKWLMGAQLGVEGVAQGVAERLPRHGVICYLPGHKESGMAKFKPRIGRVVA